MVGTCLLHVKYFQFSAVAVQIQLGGQKTVGTCLLHVKYFQFSTASFQSLQSCRFPCCAGVSLALGCLGCCCCWSLPVPVPAWQKSLYIYRYIPAPFPCPILPSLLPPPLPPHTYILYAGRACAIEMHMDPSVLAAQCGNRQVHLPILQPTSFQ